MSIFSGQIAMTGEPVTILRASRVGNWQGLETQRRGLDRDVYAQVAFGTHKDENRHPIDATAVISSQSSRGNKRESGEIRDASLQAKFSEPVYQTDDEAAEYADIVFARDERWKVVSVRLDRLGGLWVAELKKIEEC